MIPRSEFFWMGWIDNQYDKNGAPLVTTADAPFFRSNDQAVVRFGSTQSGRGK